MFILENAAAKIWNVIWASFEKKPAFQVEYLLIIR